MNDEEQKLDIKGEEQELDIKAEEEPDIPEEKPYTNEDEEKPKYLKYCMILVYLGGLGFFASIPLACMYYGWIALIGIGFFFACFISYIVPYGIWFIKTLNSELKRNAAEKRTPEKEQELMDEVNSARTREESQMARAKYYAGDEVDSVGELFAASFGFDKKARRTLKTVSVRDKLKVIAIFASFGITLLVFTVGIALANAEVQPIGFILMGAGGGGFALIIATLVIISVLQRNGYLSSRSYSERGKRDTEIVRTGKVFRCAIHSQTSVGARTPRITDTLYQVVVVPEGSNEYLNMLCSSYHTEGETVKFYQDINHPRRVRLIEDDDVYYPADYMPGVDDEKERLLEIKKSLEDEGFADDDEENDEQ